MSTTTDNSHRAAVERASTIKRVAEILSDIDSLPVVARQGAPLPSHAKVREIVAICRRLLFPGFFSDGALTRDNSVYHMGVDAEALLDVATEQIAAALRFDNCATEECLTECAAEKAMRLLESLPAMRHVLQMDVDATFDGDPAATSRAEVIFSYPGFRATVNHRIAHQLCLLEVPVLPRMIAEMAHNETGIDIHPAASIGEGLMIDHGTGVVVGATAIIGRNVKLYQGVTLGARSFVRDADHNPVKGLPRHPVVGDNVVIYSNTTVLGRITIGAGAVIGGNLWVTESVAPGERLVQAAPDNIIRVNNKPQP